MITVTKVPARKLVLATMSGFLTTDEVACFSAREQQAVAEMGLRSGEFLLLVNTEDAVIQSQDVVAALTHLVAASPAKARRIAVVRGGSLTRMQTHRILRIRADTALFETLAEAERWLFAGENEALPSYAERGRRSPRLRADASRPAHA